MAQKTTAILAAWFSAVCIPQVAFAQDTNPLTYPITSTNQSTCYSNDSEIACPKPGEAFYGQDGNYRSGLPVSYTKNDDGTVFDNVTGLMWQYLPEPDKFTWPEAVDYASVSTLAGYDDWRLPTLKELFSIADFSKGWPYLDTEYFPLAGDIVDKSQQFWSSNEYVGTTVEAGDNSAFGVNSVTGHIKAYPAFADMSEATEEQKASNVPPPPPPGANADLPNGNPLAKHMRLVRGGSYGTNMFQDNGDGTVTDLATGLMWAKEDSGEGLDWPSALAYAEASTLAGHDDWRLPNVRELQSIVDYSYAPGAPEEAQNRAAIDPVFSATGITNEAGDPDFGYYWSGTSASFTRGEPFYYAWYVALGRAVNDEGQDMHGAGAVRFDTKVKDGPNSEGGERYFNFVRLVRTAS